jgi:1-acyl-sn-glycerol-3-phosphate acyltransferase
MTHTIAIEADKRDRKRFYFHATGFRKVAVFFVQQLFRLLMEIHVEGLENLPPEGPAILAANHVSNFDVFPMQFSLPRPIFFMGKAELFRFPPLDWALRQLGGFPVFRGEKDAWAMRHARRVLDHGQVLGMFPEGTRSKGRGLGPAKTGTARLAIEVQCPIVPVAIAGSEDVLMWVPRRACVTLRYLLPVWPQPGETEAGLTARLMLSLASALPPASRGAYAAMPTETRLKVD